MPGLEIFPEIFDVTSTAQRGQDRRLGGRWSGTRKQMWSERMLRL